MEDKNWVLDNTHSEVNFKVKHLMISTVTGSIDKFNVQVKTEGNDFNNAHVIFEADMNSINTNNEQRDGHLKSADFFDVEKYPNLTFRSTGMTKKGDGYELQGDLTIKNITKSISIPVDFGGLAKDPWGNQKAAFSIDVKINREDFGLHWNAALETGGVLVSQEVRILAEVQLLQQVEQVA